MRLCKENDIVFVCEHWLKVYEVSQMELHLKDAGFWSHFKSSMDPEVIINGRPYGGVAFICRTHDNISYREIEVDNDRICIIQVLYHFKPILTVIGVYMPYYNGKGEQFEKYIETLDTLQSVVELYGVDTPCMLCGDFNTNLPQHRSLDKLWYKHHPFNEYSALLYDFICDNDMYISNFSFKQRSNHTYFKGHTKSYIDHVIVPNRISSYIKECIILDNEHECIVITTQLKHVYRCQYLHPTVTLAMNVTLQKH